MTKTALNSTFGNSNHFVVKVFGLPSPSAPWIPFKAEDLGVGEETMQHPGLKAQKHSGWMLLCLFLNQPVKVGYIEAQQRQQPIVTICYYLLLWDCKITVFQKWRAEDVAQTPEYNLCMFVLKKGAHIPHGAPRDGDSWKSGKKLMESPWVGSVQQSRWHVTQWSHIRRQIGKNWYPKRLMPRLHDHPQMYVGGQEGNDSVLSSEEHWDIGTTDPRSLASSCSAWWKLSR